MTFLADEDATARMGARLASMVRPGDVICLHGDLGAGKSTLARALIRAAAGDPFLEAPSPTFTLVQTYETSRGSLWHFDLYRLSEPEEVIELGWEDALADGILLVEWPERLGALLPRDRLDLFLAMGPDGEGRVLRAAPAGSAWEGRWADIGSDPSAAVGADR